MGGDDPFGWVGATIDGKYRVDAVVGEGGFGVVYRGHHAGLDAPIAIKCLKIDRTLGRDAFLKSFVAEGRILHRLSRACVSIVQGLDVGAAESPRRMWTPFLVLEWLEGETLESFIAARFGATGRGLSPSEAIELFAPAAEALDVAHAEGVIHRDVKPANIFLAKIGGRRTIKILDFGIAKLRDTASGQTREGGVSALSPAYAAPEQFDPSIGAVRAQADVYGLARSLVDALVGHGPDGMGTLELQRLAFDRERRPTPARFGVQVSPGIEGVLERALAVDPRNRFGSCGAMWSALRAASSKALLGEVAWIDSESSAGHPRAEASPAPTARLAPAAEPMLKVVITAPMEGGPEHTTVPQVVPGGNLDRVRASEGQSHGHAGRGRRRAIQACLVASLIGLTYVGVVLLQPSGRRGSSAVTKSGAPSPLHAVVEQANDSSAPVAHGSTTHPAVSFAPIQLPCAPGFGNGTREPPCIVNPQGLWQVSLRDGVIVGVDDPASPPDTHFCLTINGLLGCAAPRADSFTPRWDEGLVFGGPPRKVFWTASELVKATMSVNAYDKDSMFDDPICVGTLAPFSNESFSLGYEIRCSNGSHFHLRLAPPP